MQNPETYDNYDDHDQLKSDTPQENLKRRRARNDPNNRDFKCGCGKSYLSYPALYTHIKQKHDGKAPEGLTRPQGNTSRGRPPGSSTKKQQDNQNEDDQESEEQADQLEIIEQLIMYISSQIQGGEKATIIFDNQEHSFEEIKDIFPSKTIFSDEKDWSPVLTELEKIYENNGEVYEEQGENNLYNTPCNKIFAQFIYLLAKHLQKYLIREIVFLICLLRKSLNENGTKYAQQKDGILDVEQLDLDAEFCEQSNGQAIIEISNSFITQYLPQYFEQYSNIQSFTFIKKDNVQTTITKFIQYFCDWLFAKKYTNDKLEYNNEEAISQQQTQQQQ